MRWWAGGSGGGEEEEEEEAGGCNPSPTLCESKQRARRVFSGHHEGAADSRWLVRAPTAGLSEDGEWHVQK